MLAPEGESFVNTEAQKLKLYRDRQALQYNKHAKNLPPLEEGDTVRLNPFRLGQKHWQKGVVTKHLDQRSYDIKPQRERTAEIEYT